MRMDRSTTLDNSQILGGEIMGPNGRKSMMARSFSLVDGAGSMIDEPYIPTSYSTYDIKPT
jgi:hypothetical protein